MSDIVDNSLAIQWKFPLLRLWEHPGLQYPRSWTVLAEYSHLQFINPFVREVRWGKYSYLPNDLSITEQLNEDATFHPETRVRDCRLSPEEYAQLDLDREFRLRQPIPGGMLITDGTEYGFQFFGFDVGISFRVSWWESGPPEWRDAVQWTRETQTFLAALCGSRAE